MQNLHLVLRTFALDLSPSSRLTQGVPIISILLFYFSVLYSILFFYPYKLFFLLRFADTDFRDDSGPQLPATSTIPDSAFASPPRAGHIAYIGFPEREISHKNNDILMYENQKVCCKLS